MKKFGIRSRIWRTRRGKRFQLLVSSIQHVQWLVLAFSILCASQRGSATIVDEIRAQALAKCQVNPEALPLFLRYPIELGLNSHEVTAHWDRVCDEFADPKDYEQAGHAQNISSAWHTFQFHLLAPYTGLFSLGFATLGDSPQAKKWNENLQRIAEIPNPLERVQATFNWARKNQGMGDEANRFQYLHPSRILDRASRNLPGGVCREFAVLLYWALLQSARAFPDLRHQFTPELAIADNHMWVRVHFPSQNPHGPGTLIESVDLDSMDYATFTPLHPRQNRELLENLPNLRAWCAKSLACMRKQGLN